ncbi:MAG: hypothetical protein CMJ25_03130 [Phycisphaerae bacterium]|nr:hypothetical protein [Phycisphaerae bacterium]
MNAQPFVQAELQKGAIVTEVASQVGEYANMRYKMITETQKNEAIFSAKEGLMALSSQLEKDRDVGNIFDGELKYERGVKSVYDELRATVGKNKYALQDFDNSFRQMEIPIKFRLQEVVDLKIEKRRQAALKARQDQQVSIYSDPYLDVTSDELAMEQAQLEAMGQQAVRNGGVNPEIMGNVPKKVLSLAFKKLVPAYAGTDLNKAIGLSAILAQIEMVRSGKIEAKEMFGISSLPPHVLNMLMAVPAEEANAVVQDTIQMASTFFTAKEKIDDEREEEVGKSNTKAYNLVVSLDSTDTVSEATLQQVLDPIDMKKVYDSLGIDFGSISGTAAQTILYEGLTRQMWASPAQQEAMEEAMSVSEATPIFRPAGKGDAEVNHVLHGMAEAGMLTVAELNFRKRSLSQSEYLSLKTKIFNEADEGLAVGNTIISKHFGYSAQMAIGRDDRLAQASKAAFQSATGALLDEHSRRESEGNPMTLAEIRSFAQKKINEFDVIYREELRAEYVDFVESRSRDLPGFTVDISDPFGSLDAWYNDLNENDQARSRNSYSIFKSILRARYANQGLFD